MNRPQWPEPQNPPSDQSGIRFNHQRPLQQVLSVSLDGPAWSHVLHRRAAERACSFAEVHSHTHPTLQHGALEPPEQPASNPPPAGWNQADKSRDVSQYTRRQQDGGCNENKHAVNE